MTMVDRRKGQRRKVTMPPNRLGLGRDIDRPNGRRTGDSVATQVQIPPEPPSPHRHPTEPAVLATETEHPDSTINSHA